MAALRLTIVWLLAVTVFHGISSLDEVDKGESCFKMYADNDYAYEMPALPLKLGYKRSHEECINGCQTAGQLYAGLTLGGVCYCAMDEKRSFRYEKKGFGNVPKDRCNMKCESGEVCGGENTTTVLHALTIIGCFKDDPADRQFKDYHWYTKGQLQQACITMCQEMHFVLASMQDGGNCFCAKKLKEEKYEKVGADECDEKCEGCEQLDSHTYACSFCGQSSRNLVAIADHDDCRDVCCKDGPCIDTGVFSRNCSGGEIPCPPGYSSEGGAALGKNYSIGIAINVIFFALMVFIMIDSYFKYRKNLKDREDSSRHQSPSTGEEFVTGLAIATSICWCRKVCVANLTFWTPTEPVGAVLHQQAQLCALLRHTKETVACFTRATDARKYGQKFSAAAFVKKSVGFRISQS